MPDIPSEFTGGWVRRGISLDGGPFQEDSTVWWLQAPQMHADLRVPLAAGTPTCFAGITTWDGRALTWTRKVDLELYGGVDTGTTSWDGEDLLEAGEFDNGDGTSTRYVERWARLPGSSGPLWWSDEEGTYTVRAGAYAIALSDRRASGLGFAGTAWVHSGGAWTVHHSLPEVEIALPPADDWSAR